jgi:hypothetical protein
MKWYIVKQRLKKAREGWNGNPTYDNTQQTVYAKSYFDAVKQGLFPDHKVCSVWVECKPPKKPSKRTKTEKEKVK